jgi:hypothetical protein
MRFGAEEGRLMAFGALMWYVLYGILWRFRISMGCDRVMEGGRGETVVADMRERRTAMGAWAAEHRGGRRESDKRWDTTVFSGC